MKKILIIISNLLLTSSFVNPMMSFSNISTIQNNSEYDEFEELIDEIRKDAIFKMTYEKIEEDQKPSNDNFVQTLKNEDLTIYLDSLSKNYEKRIYADSSEDDWIPEENKEYDKVFNKISRDTWYENSFVVRDINIEKYAESKTDFLKKIKYINLEADFLYNFWNSKKNWTDSDGKYAKYIAHKFSVRLRGHNKVHKLMEKNDEDHRSNESVKVSIEENWSNDNKNLKIKINLGVKVHWKKGSIYHHAAILGIINENVTLSNKKLDGTDYKEKTYYNNIPAKFSLYEDIDGQTTQMGNNPMSALHGIIYKNYEEISGKELSLKTLNGIFVGKMNRVGYRGGSILSLPHMEKVAEKIMKNIDKGFPISKYNLFVRSYTDKIVMETRVIFKVDNKEYDIVSSNKIPYLPKALFMFSGTFNAKYRIEY